SAWKASDGNSVPFNSCSNNTSGSRAFSHVVTWVNRERTEFKFQLANLDIDPHSSVAGEVPPLFNCPATRTADCESSQAPRANSTLHHRFTAHEFPLPSPPM